jgi:hypothetical protein
MKESPEEERGSFKKKRFGQETQITKYGKGKIITPFLMPLRRLLISGRSCSCFFWRTFPPLF